MKGAWQAITKAQLIRRVGGGPTAGDFWRITLACGHQIHRTTSNKPNKNAVCPECRSVADRNTEGK